MLASLLPAVQERLKGLGALLRLAEPAGPLDAYGMDPTLLLRAAPLLDFLYLSWWRVEASSAAKVPAHGPVVVVANHGGHLPWDALVLRLALRREHPAHRDLRPLLDAAALARPALGPALQRLGAVPATPDNAARLLGEGAALAVFPEGSAPRPWPQRYRIGAFGRGGFVKVALRAGAAIVPCAVVGSEEASPALGRPGYLAEALRLPILGSALALPLGPLGGLPLPARWTLAFGDPIDLGGAGPEAAADPAEVARLTALVRGRLQAMLDEAVAARRSVFL
jgi:1-acyl-sn-glycerol-3-phosphate acyltransferase